MQLDAKNSELVVKPATNYHIWRFVAVIGTILWVTSGILLGSFISGWIAFGMLACPAIAAYAGVICFGLWLLTLQPLYRWLTEKKPDE